MQDNDGDVELGHGLLETQVAVAGDEHVKLLFSQSQQRTVLDAAPALLLRRDGVVTGHGAGQPPVEALVNEKPHQSDRFEHGELAGFNDRDGLLAFNGRERIEEIFDGLAAFQIVHEVLERDARADEDRRAAHDLRVGVNNAFQFFKFYPLRI